jgi:sodium/proline symporter
MNDMVWSFLALTGLITAFGAISVTRRRKTTGDYLVASREVKPWLAALSAVATNNSGFMFIGMIAYTYRLGIEAVWMMAGWVLGDLTAWFLVHPRVRRISGERRANTLPALLGSGSGSGPDRLLIAVAGVVTFLFLGVYAAGQLKAGSTALRALFGWQMEVGALIGAAIVVIYCFAGGIRATIWTDAVQSLVMIATMVMILVAGFLEIGGWQAVAANLRDQDPALVNLMPAEPALGFGFYLAGFMFAGFGVIGQPQIMVRLIAIESVEAIRSARFFYFLWYIPFFLASIGVGLYCRALIPDLAELPVAQGLEAPTELALPLITMRLLPDIVVGIALAGLFAATISTADSQIIVCSGSVTNDINPRWKKSYLASKASTLSIGALALLIALYAPEGVFGLVLVAWSVLGASLGSVLLLRLYNRALSLPTALAMMGAGVVAVVGWHLSPYNDDVFKILPGFVAAFAVYLLSRLKRFRPT